ncbi:M67 family metallopeptidase [Acaryochloris sp. IP29b_bin.137]|uniref:M67 family metallopeptidase n=1 Tax=Acaryochloris sp. IP29b_bin.137 TaxID=2969217 RepID=UPI00262CE1E6|nr:M67 family metallopeptidase [Acaryochloris sp. IP29b_bin.137]
MLNLQAHHMDQIQAHARDCYPEECCGLMLGHRVETADQSQKTLLALYPMDNAWDQANGPIEEKTSCSPLTAARRYWIAPQDLFNAQKYARTQGWDIIGVYHSHPDHEAVPSECDRKWAWPQYSYVIVAVNRGVPHDLRSWILDDQQQFRSEPVAVSAVAPTVETDI